MSKNILNSSLPLTNFVIMKSNQPVIYFHYLHQKFVFKNRKKLKSFIEKIFKIEQTHLQELHYIFCSDEYLLRLNLDYLYHNTFTDVVTFTLSEVDAPVFGEVYISIERIRENLTLYKTTFSHELHRVMFHGALHLCGYKDKTKIDLKKMRAKEDFYLNLYSS